MIYASKRFGNFEITEDQIIQFSEGLYGFEDEKLFTLLPLNPNTDNPLEWMHSLKTPELVFMVTDPYLYIPDYRLSLTEEDKKLIQLAPGDATAVRVLVTVPANWLEMTANMLGPIVINTTKKIARQFVLTTPEYDTRHYLLAAEVRKPKTKTRS